MTGPHSHTAGGGTPGLLFRMTASGSRLYLLKRRKLTNKTPQDAREYMQQALAWMTDDGVAARIDVTSERTGTDTLAAGVTIYQRDGVIHNITFDDIWSELNG